MMRAWLEDRLGWPSALQRWLEEPVPAVRPGFFPAVLALLLLEAGTGLALSLTYAPTPRDAWSSVLWTQTHLPLMALLRSVHRLGVSALVIVVSLQLLESMLRGSYRAPREVAWFASLGLLLLVLGYAMTGNPLPWDQRGYWQSQVEARIMGSVPVVGGLVRQIFQGGNAYGATTVPRFYALHVLVLPAVTLGLLLARRASQRRHLEAGPARRSSQLALDLAVGLLAMAAVAVLATRIPAPLEAPADPGGGYLARPEWYFLPLNQLLSFFPGALEPVGSMVIPGLLVTILAVLPFLDRGARGRVLAAGGLAFCALLMGGLFTLGTVREARDTGLARSRLESSRQSMRAQKLASAGIPPQGALAMMHEDPLYVGEQVWKQRCAGCHLIGGEGTDKPKGPDLAGYLSREWLRAVVNHPREKRFFGTTKITGMDDYDGRDRAEVDQTVELLALLRDHPGVKVADLPPEARPLLAAYSDLSCDNCHELDPGVDGAAPNLNGYGSDAWLAGLIKDGSGSLYYQDQNQMTKLAGKVTDAEIAGVITWLRTYESLPVGPLEPVTRE